MDRVNEVTAPSTTMEKATPGEERIISMVDMFGSVQPLTDLCMYVCMYVWESGRGKHELKGDGDGGGGGGGDGEGADRVRRLSSYSSGDRNDREKVFMYV